MRIFEGRRLTGRHPLVARPGAALEIALDADEDADATLERIATRLKTLAHALGWPEPVLRSARHPGGLSLAFEAPVDQLYLAVDLLECAAGEGLLDEDRFDQFRAVASTERKPHLRALMARFQDAPAFFDEDGFTLGLGFRERTWPLDALPEDDELQEEVGRVPFVYVTGTNGKTTTTRMIAAIARAGGFHPGHTSSDGVVLDGQLAREGDWTGPGAARLVLRSTRVDFAVLETARGGLMRRGLVLDGADAAVVTNISDDHLGEWGLHTIEDMARAKCVVADAVRPGGVLVVHAQNGPLQAVLPEIQARRPDLRIFRFADGPESPELAAWVDQEQLVVRLHDKARVLGDIGALPATLGGAARHNVENALAAALAALACGIAPEAIVDGLRGFRPGLNDSRGRMNLFRLPSGARVLLDFAHNPDGLRRLGPVVARLRRGRVAVLLGSAGDRRDEDIEAMAAEILPMRPERVVLKELPKHRRGRVDGEVRQILRSALTGAGLADEALHDVPEEVDATAAILDWLRPDDLGLLLVHEEVDGVLALLTARGAEEA